jgi:hypothetical protein
VVGGLLIAVLLALWAAIYLSLRARPVAAAPTGCATISAGDQRSLLWLMQLRRDHGMPLAEISVRPCVDGTHSGAMAFVDVGRSPLVQEFFADEHDCDVRSSCWITTDGGPLMVRLSFVSGDGWYVIVRPEGGS